MQKKYYLLENKYIITNDGEIYTLLNDKRKIKKQKLRKHSNGYLRATIFGKDMYVHRLVAMCFLDNPNNYPEISHEDNDKTNNKVENLKWCNRSYNNKKMFIDGIKTRKQMQEIAKKPKYKLRKITPELLDEIRYYLALGYSDIKISKITNISKGSIYQIRKGKTYNE